MERRKTEEGVNLKQQKFKNNGDAKIVTFNL